MEFGSRYRAETEKLYPYSGPAQDLLNQVIRGTASMVPSIVGNLVLPGSGLYINMLQSVGGAMAEAKKRGADDSTALAYGASVGIADTLLEKLVDGLGGVLGKGVLDRMIGTEVRRAAVSPAAQEALIYLGGMVGEGFEEFLSVFADEMLNVHMLGTTARTWEELLKEGGTSFFSGMLVSGLIQGASRLGQLIDAGADDLTVEDLGRQLAQEVDAYLRESPEEADIREPDLAGEAEYILDAEYVPETEHVPETQPVAEPEQKASDFDIDSAEDQVYTQEKQNPAPIRVYNARGLAFEDEMFPELWAVRPNAKQHITLLSFSGTRMVADAIAESGENQITIMEYKSTLRARLSKNQKRVFEDLQEHEAFVRGEGKGIFTAGKRIPPVTEGTKIFVQRPGQVEEWKPGKARKRNPGKGRAEEWK